MTQPKTAVRRTDFDRTTWLAPVPGSPGEFSVELDPGWSSPVGVHGGSLYAIAARGEETSAPDRSVRTLSTSFLPTAQVGPATLVVREVRAGRSITMMATELSQAGRLLTTSRLTLLTDRPGVEWSAPVPLDLPAPEECVEVDAGRLAHFQQAQGGHDPRSLPFSGGAEAVVRRHVPRVEGRHVDAAWLAMVTDWFPPPAFARVAPPTGGVSIDLATHVHQTHLVLEDQWLTASFSIETGSGGLAVEHGVLAELDGTLVAESFQTRLTAKG